MNIEKTKKIALLLVFAAIFAYSFDNIKDVEIKNKNPNDSRFSSLKKKDDIMISADRKTVYLDIEQNDFSASTKYGRIVIELFDDIVPKTSENFYQLCKNGKYASVPFHRVINNFMVQGGDIVNFDGSSGQSIYGETFEDENFLLKHSEAGLVSMANSGPDSNNSQFFITLAPQPHLNNKHVVFGKVTSGMNYIHEIGNRPTDMDDKPLQDVIIKNCGLMN